MKLYTLLLTNNDCYKTGKTMTPKGIMVHSTGANNPNLKRYVGPDDGMLGFNINGNHWNTPKPDGRQICPHAFIGKLKDGTIATYQTLPWNMRGWHSGSGNNGSANNLGYIGFEICEDGLNDGHYFEQAYREAVELCVYLCKRFGLTEKDIICHSEGHALGIASNHGDIMHWWPKFGKNMDTFRADVSDALSDTVAKVKTSSVKTSTADLDNEPHDWSRDAVEWAVQNQLMIGDDKGDLMLREPITREQFCVMLKRYDDMK